MTRVAFVYHPDYLLHAPPFEHPESPERLRAIVEHLESAGLLGRMIPVTPDYAKDEDVLRVHDPDYLRKVELACRRGDITLDSEDTYLNRHSYTTALLSAGGAIAGVDAVLSGKADRAFCAIRPPGHHAGRAEGMGFCLLNNAAIAARYAQAKGGASRVLIVDWDVHHGNGTQAIFLEDPTVFYFSIHEHPTFLYPGTGRRWETGKGAGEGTTLNSPMAPGAGDEECRAAMEQLLVPAAEAFRPDLVVVSAGFDAHRDDPLADLQLTEDGYRDMTRCVVGLARKLCRGRVVSLLEGGYDFGSLTRSVEAHVTELLSD